MIEGVSIFLFLNADSRLKVRLDGDLNAAKSTDVVTPFILGIYHSSHYQLSTTQSLLLATYRKKPFENIVGKGESACHLYFLEFPQCFLVQSVVYRT